MASEWELAHRVEEQVFRILLFKRQVELLERLSAAWAERWRAENRSFLQEVGLT